MLPKNSPIFGTPSTLALPSSQSSSHGPRALCGRALQGEKKLLQTHLVKPDFFSVAFLGGAMP
jgi:hypothetical protein